MRTSRGAGSGAGGGRSAGAGTTRAPATRAPATRAAGALAKAAGRTTPAARPARGTTSPKKPATLCYDIGGTGLKASVLDADGKMLADRVREATRYPCGPEDLVERLVALARPLPAYDRVSAGFPGAVRRGTILTAPHFVTKKGPGSAIVPELMKAWTGFDLAGALEEQLGKPVRVANDADLQGLDVVAGHGLELVVTLGTGVGTAVFEDGWLSPHLELAHQPFRKGETYNEVLGEASLKKMGTSKWRKRVLEALANFEDLLHYDHLYIGGGNSGLMKGHIGDNVTIVDNIAGILGGIKLWQER